MSGFFVVISRAGIPLLRGIFRKSFIIMKFKFKIEKVLRQRIGTFFYTPKILILSVLRAFSGSFI